MINDLIFMIIRPRKFKYETTFRNKNIKTYKNTKLVFGNFGLYCPDQLTLTTKHTQRYMLIIKKVVRRSNKTYRYYWFVHTPEIPVTKKTKGSRMGKGKGKPTIWIFKVRRGTIFVEFKGIRFGRFLKFFKVMGSKLNIRIFFKTALLKNNKTTSTNITPQKRYLLWL